MISEPRAVFRLSSDFGAESPLWFADMVLPDDLGLDRTTCIELRAWSAYFTRHFDPLSGWRAGADGAWYEREGERLARQVARELGSDFAVDHRPAMPTVIRSPAPAARHEAAAAADSLVQEYDRRRRENRFRTTV